MNATKEYLEAKVLSAPPHQLHLFVVEGAIRAASRAERALDAGDIETAHLSLNQARGLVGELISGIDAGQAPELASNLNGLLVFVFRRLVDADLRHDARLVRDALKILSMHRDTWLKVCEKLNTGQPTTGPHTDLGRRDATGRSWTT